MAGLLLGKNGNRFSQIAMLLAGVCCHAPRRPVNRNARAKRQLFALVLRQSMLPIVLGLLAGFVLSLLLRPFLSSLLFGVRPTDIPTFGVGALILSTAGLIACLLPARRATRVDPMIGCATSDSRYFTSSNGDDFHGTTVISPEL